MSRTETIVTLTVSGFLLLTAIGLCVLIRRESAKRKKHDFSRSSKTRRSLSSQVNGSRYSSPWIDGEQHHDQSINCHDNKRNASRTELLHMTSNDGRRPSETFSGTSSESSFTADTPWEVSASWTRGVPQPNLNRHSGMPPLSRVGRPVSKRHGAVRFVRSQSMAIAENSLECEQLSTFQPVQYAHEARRATVPSLSCSRETTKFDSRWASNSANSHT